MTKRKNLHFPNHSIMINIKFVTEAEKVAFISDTEFAIAFSKLMEVALRHSRNAQVSSKTNP